MNPTEETVLAVQMSHLDRKLDEVHASVKEDLEEVKAQARRTNGRVSKLEERTAMLKGGLIVVSAGLPFLLFVISKLVEQ